MSPNVQIITGYTIIGICAVVGFMGGLMVRNGYEKKKEQSIISRTVVPQLAPESQTSEKEAKQKFAKIQINRIIEDAVPWIDERIEQNKAETEKITSGFNSRGTLYSGMHIGAQIKRVNIFIKSINDFIKEMNRKIEDILLDAGEEKLDSIAWLKDEHKKYTDFIERTKKVKDSIKQQNNDLCLRFTDKPTFENILKAQPYTE